jgi:hypothetical protein
LTVTNIVYSKKSLVRSKKICYSNTNRKLNNKFEGKGVLKEMDVDHLFVTPFLFLILREKKGDMGK